MQRTLAQAGDAAALADDMREALTRRHCPRRQKSVALGAHAKALISPRAARGAAAAVERWLAATWKRPPPPPHRPRAPNYRLLPGAEVRDRAPGGRIAAPPPSCRHTAALGLAPHALLLPGLRLWVATARAATAAGSWAPSASRGAAATARRLRRLSSSLVTSPSPSPGPHAVAAAPPPPQRAASGARATRCSLSTTSSRCSGCPASRLTVSADDDTDGRRRAAAAAERLAIVLKLLAAHAAEVAAAGGDSRTLRSTWSGDELRRTLRVPAARPPGRPLLGAAVRRRRSRRRRHVRVVAGESEDYLPTSKMRRRRCCRRCRRVCSPPRPSRE